MCVCVYKVNITFLCTEKPKSYDSLYRIIHLTEPTTVSIQDMPVLLSRKVLPT